MSTIVTRAGKGSALTHTEMDANITNLNNDKYQSGDSPAFGNEISVGTYITHSGDTNTYIRFDSDRVRIVCGNVTLLDLYEGTADDGDLGGNLRVTNGGSARLMDTPFWENKPTVSSNYTITNDYNAMSAGPITINSGVTVTVGDNEAWTIV